MQPMQIIIKKYFHLLFSIVLFQDVYDFFDLLLYHFRHINTLSNCHSCCSFLVSLSNQGCFVCGTLQCSPIMIGVASVEFKVSVKGHLGSQCRSLHSGPERCLPVLVNYRKSECLRLLFASHLPHQVSVQSNMLFWVILGHRRCLLYPSSSATTIHFVQGHFF